MPMGRDALMLNMYEYVDSFMHVPCVWRWPRRQILLQILIKKANTDRQDAVFNADSNGGKCKPRSISEKQGSREEAEEDSKVDWSEVTGLEQKNMHFSLKFNEASFFS